MITIFENELERGSGFPVVALKRKLIIPTPVVDEIIFDNIINNKSYDCQCEGSKHKYLFRVVSEYDNKEKIFSKVIDYFEIMTGNDYGESQVFGFLCIMAENKLIEKSVLYSKIVSYGDEITTAFSFGVHHLICLDKMYALKYFTALFGKRINENNIKDFDTIPFYEYFSEELGICNDEIRSLLRNENDPDIDNYLDLIPVKDRTEKKRNRKTIDKVIDKLKSQKFIPLNFWIKGASIKEINKLCDLFKNTNDRFVKKSIISGFSERKIDLNINILFDEFDKSRDVNYKEKLIDAMIQYNDPDVRKFIENKDINKNTKIYIKVLLAFYSNTDKKYPVIFLEDFDAYEIHDLTFFILKINHIKKYPIYFDLLRLMYRRNKCSICREDIVKEMYDFGFIDTNLSEEIAYDRNEKINKFGL